MVASQVDDDYLSTSDDSSSVRVAVRVRPFQPSECGNSRCVQVLSSSGTSAHTDMIQIGGETGKSFIFDDTFEHNSTQRQVFVKSVLPLVEACLHGYNATVLAYGQTGSGKTFTVLGPSNAATFEGDLQTQPDPGPNSFRSQTRVNSGHSGIIPRAVRELFRRLESLRVSSQEKGGQGQGQGQGGKQDVGVVEDTNNEPPPPYEYTVRIQFLEVYGEVIRDLLSKTSTKLAIRDGGHSVEPEVIGALEVKVSNAEEALLCLTRGALRRVTGATAMNAESSRSHAIMSVLVEQSTVIEPVSGESEPAEVAHREIETKRSKFHFVDLAGSERQKRSQAVGKRLKEGININKGLLVLGNVISALGDPSKRGKTFVPYRDSKLTRLLKGSLGGNHKTLMIACVSPSSSNMEETLNCLRYANRAKNIQNNAVVNVDSGSRVVTELRAQVQALASELLKFQCEENKENDSPLFSTDVLRALVTGKDSTGLQIASNSTANANPREGDSSASLRNNDQSKKDEEFRKRIDTADAQITILREKMKQSQHDALSKSEELFAANAEKEYYRLQMPGNENELPNSGISSNGDSNQAFLEKATAYEREISRLKEKLRDARASTNNFDDNQSRNTNVTIHSTISGDMSDTTLTYRKSNMRRTLSEAFESEATAEQNEIEHMARKYLKFDEGSEMITEEDEEKQDDSKETVEDKEEAFMLRQAQLDAHMLQLTKGIAAKEELVSQLRVSQDKYESMRVFYQDKLGQMQLQLAERETEKSRLVAELQKHKKDSHKFTMLQEAVESKEKEIYQLKKKEADISKLTTISSRNETILSRLAFDIAEMKKQKNALEKQLSKERKEHALAMQLLRKDLLAQERDAARSRQELSKSLAERDRLHKIAKQNAEELGKIRSKYRESEKRIRMQTLKSGVMEQIGIDAVMVGRRQGRKSKSDSRDARSRSLRNVDQIRSFLDDKIAEIGRKEAAADKLAKEWESHYELNARKQELLKKLNKNGKGFSNDELEALDIQIHFKEDAIRQLAQHLGDRPRSSGNGNLSQYPFIENRKFKDLCGDMPALSSAQLAAKVLFGMVVRERKRVAALARTASSLDQKVMDAEKMAASKDSALRSHMEEARHERATMAQNQQEKILSLMSLVQQEGGHSDMNSVVTVKASSRVSDDVVLQLAYERIDILETQIAEFQGERETMEAFKSKEAETTEELLKMNAECGRLQKELKRLRILFKELRNKFAPLAPRLDRDSRVDISMLSNDDMERPYRELLDIVENALKKQERKSKDNCRETVSMSLTDTDDSCDDDATQPVWAGDIMEDLAIIAAGDIPASLHKITPKRPPVIPDVFERLTDPDNFTGVQKNAFLSNFDQNSHASGTDSKYSRRRGTRSASSASLRFDDQSSVMSGTDSKYSRSSSLRRGSNRSRASTPKSSKTKKSARVSPPKTPSGPPREVSLPVGKERSFVKAYTQTDVFERLQRKVTNSYEFRRKEENIERLQDI